MLLHINLDLNWLTRRKRANNWRVTHVQLQRMLNSNTNRQHTHCSATTLKLPTFNCAGSPCIVKTALTSRHGHKTSKGVLRCLEISGGVFGFCILDTACSSTSHRCSIRLATGELEARSTPWALRCVPWTATEQFFWYVRAHCPVWGGVLYSTAVFGWLVCFKCVSGAKVSQQNNKLKDVDQLV